MLTFLYILYLSGLESESNSWFKRDIRENIEIFLLTSGIIILWPVVHIVYLFVYYGFFYWLHLKTFIEEIIKNDIFMLYEFSQTKNHEKIQEFIKKIEGTGTYQSFKDSKKSRKIVMNFSTPLNRKIKMIFINKRYNADQEIKGQTYKYITIRFK